MKLFTPKFNMWLMVVLVLVAPLLVAAGPWLQGGEPAIPEAALTFLTMLALPAIAQAYKVYRERGGKPLSSEAINWTIFGLGVVASFLWGGAAGFLRALALPALDASDPLALTGAILTFVNNVIVAGGQVVGVATVYYLALKTLVFKYIPALQTARMVKEIEAAQ